MGNSQSTSSALALPTGSSVNVTAAMSSSSNTSVVPALSTVLSVAPGGSSQPPLTSTVQNTVSSTAVSTITLLSISDVVSTITQQASTITQAAAPAAQAQGMTVTVETTIATTLTVTPTLQQSASAATQPSTMAPEVPNQSTPAQTLQGAGVMAMEPTITQPKKGPFSPVAAVLGGVPNKNVDVPATAVFLALFVIGAVSHFTRNELNNKKGHKFIMSDMMFDFCMVRNVTCIMRIVWAFRPANNSIVLAAQIFENAGVVVLFAVNVIFTQRIVRAKHPRFGWNPIVSKFFTIILISVPMIIVWNITNLTISFFTLNERVITILKKLLLFGSCWTLFLCIFPAIWVVFATAIPSSSPTEKFGSGSFRAKCIILMLAVALLFVGALTRLLGIVLERPIFAPTHLFSKAVFYTTGFMLEIIVVYFYLLIRIDLRFWVPNGAKGPGDYTVDNQGDEEKIFGGAARDDVSSFYAEDLRPTVEDVRYVVEQANRSAGGAVVGIPLDSVSDDVVLYAFKVQRQPTTPMMAMPRRPPRSSDWSGRSSEMGSGEDNMV